MSTKSKTYARRITSPLSTSEQKTIRSFSQSLRRPQLEKMKLHYSKINQIISHYYEKLRGKQDGERVLLKTPVIEKRIREFAKLKERYRNIFSKNGWKVPHEENIFDRVLAAKNSRHQGHFEGAPIPAVSMKARKTSLRDRSQNSELHLTKEDRIHRNTGFHNKSIPV